MYQTAKQTRDRARRVRLKRDIEAKPGALAEAPGVGHTLVEPGLDMLAVGHRPAAVTDAGFAPIRDNYLNATPELVALRAVDEQGFVTPLSETIGVARMYLDHSTLSHREADMEADEGSATASGSRLAAGVRGRGLFDERATSDIGPFGTCAPVVLSAAQERLRRGPPWAKVARVAVDAVQLAVAAGMTGRSLPPPKDVQAVEERAVEPLVEAMRISRAEAKRYVAMAKRVEDEGRFGS